MLNYIKITFYNDSQFVRQKYSKGIEDTSKSKILKKVKFTLTYYT